MGKLDRASRAVTKIHRVAAGLFLLSIVPAAWASFQGGDPANPSPLVFVPLPFLFALVITGTWQLVAPWARRVVLRREARLAGRAGGKP